MKYLLVEITHYSSSNPNIFISEVCDTLEEASKFQRLHTQLAEAKNGKNKTEYKIMSEVSTAVMSKVA